MKTEFLLTIYYNVKETDAENKEKKHWYTSWSNTKFSELISLELYARQYGVLGVNGKMNQIYPWMYMLTSLWYNY